MKAKLKSAVKEAMKAKDSISLDTLRLLLTSIQYEEMQTKVDDLSTAEILTVISREIKKKKEEIEFAEKAGRSELISDMNKQLALLESYLPKQMSRTELKDTITQIRTELTNPNMGTLMQALKERFNGQYDGKMASEVTKEVLAQS
jgi:uncharacterized protein YqeY